MTSPGGVLRHYLELALSRSPGFKSIDDDVALELEALGAALDHAAATDAFALGALTAIRDRLAALEARVDTLERAARSIGLKV